MPLWNDSGSSSASTSLMRLADSFSRPLVALSTRQGCDRKGARPRTFSRRLWDGTAMTIMSTAAASSLDAVTRRFDGKWYPGSRLLFSRAASNS